MKSGFESLGLLSVTQVRRVGREHSSTGPGITGTEMVCGPRRRVSYSTAWGSWVRVPTLVPGAGLRMAIADPWWRPAEATCWDPEGRLQKSGSLAPTMMSEL